MDDLISRQAAIDALNHEYRCGDIISQCGIEVAIDIISELPTIQPEHERTMEEFMYGQDMGNPEDGSL